MFLSSFSLEGESIGLESLLEAREQRAQLQSQCLAQYGQTLLSVTQLAVGAVKKNPLLDWIFDRALAQLRLCFQQLELEPTAEFIRPLATGNEAIFVLNIDAEKLKQAMIALEDSSPLARLWDLDVFAPTGELLSRQAFGYAPRPCLICTENAKICARQRSHSADEIVQEMQHRVQMQQFADWVAEKVDQALRAEARLTPKPSLVDSANSGSHRDMDLQTFLASATALKAFWAQFVLRGTDLNLEPNALFAAIRPLGIQAEQAMFKATNGVNTHKGAIFAFGLICAAMGRLFQQSSKSAADFSAVLHIENICQLVSEMTAGLSAELQNYAPHLPLTAGVKLFQQYGLTGARGEAEAGFPLVRKHFAILLNQNSDLTHRALILLLHLMAENQDTNVVHRGGLDGLNFVQQQAQQILCDLNDRNNAWLTDRLQQFDQACIQRNLSAGGSADLLALSFFFYFLTLN